MSTVNNVSSTSASTSGSSAVTNASSNMNESDFLQLLVTEMTNQDPMQPMNDTQMVSEMAQFSSLEQMNNMNATMQMSQATSLIGAQVTWTSSSGVTETGTVGSVTMSSGTPYLLMQSSQVGFSSITNGLNSSDPSAMVGKTISWKDTSGNTESGVVQSVDTSNSTVEVGGASITLSQVAAVNA